MELTNLMNRKYYLCIEDRYAAAVMQEWIRSYKSVPLTIRNANEAKGIYGSFVLIIQDKNGDHLGLINRIAKLAKAKIKVV